MQDVESSPPGTVMDTSSPRDDAGSSNTPIKSPTPSQKAREWEKRINQSMGGKHNIPAVTYSIFKLRKNKNTAILLSSFFLYQITHQNRTEN